MNIKTKIFQSSLILLGLFIGACQNDQIKNTQGLIEELSSREKSMFQSQQQYEVGLEAYKQDDMEKANQFFQGAVGTCDRNVQAWMALGVLEYENENFFNSAKAFYRASCLKPDRFEPRFNLGKVFENVGRYNQAMEEYEIALKLAPEQLEVMENLASCYIKSNSANDKAEELIRKALEREKRPKWQCWLRNQLCRLERLKKSHS